MDVAILCCHVLGTAFLLLTPFVAQCILPLVLHVVLLLAIVMHWVAGHYFCILSLAEVKLRSVITSRQVAFDDGVLTRILKPFFTFGHTRPWAYVAAALLASLSICRAVRLYRQEKDVAA